MTDDDLEERLDRLESRLEDQQATIDDQQETIREQRERIEQLESDDDVAETVTRRDAVRAGGLLAMLGLGSAAAGTASADPQGQVGTAGDPLQRVVARQLTIARSPYDGTNDQTLTDLTGGELALSEGTLGIGTDAVGTGALAPGAVTTETVATDAVTTDAIATDAVTASTIALSTIAGTRIVVADAALSVQTTPLETKLTASDAQDGDEFGRAVAVDADGTTAVVGAPFEDGSGDDRGKAYVYNPTTNSSETQLVASDAANGDEFGRGVAVSGDGTTAVVGAPREDGTGSSTFANRGKAYVYDLPASSTPATETTQLVASDAQDGDRFGDAVAVSGDGTTAVVGAPAEDSSGSDSGKAYVYDLPASSTPATETSQLVASDAQDGDRFGTAVAVADDGTSAVVGAPREDDPGVASGTAYVYDLTASPPVETSQLTAGDAQEGDFFGQGVEIDGDGSRVLVGAPRGDEGSTDTGAAYSYLPVAIGSF